MVAGNVPDNIGRGQLLEQTEIAGAKGVCRAPVGECIGMITCHDSSTLQRVACGPAYRRHLLWEPLVAYDTSMLGVLSLKLLLSSPDVIVHDPARRYRAEAGLADAVAALPPWPRGIMQRGLLRANSVLVGAYVAPEHRACPLASAVWETTGKEPASMYQVQLGLAELGLDSDQTSTFVAAFDEWAIACEHVRRDADGTTVLTHGGRSELLRLFENANRVDA